MTHPIVDIRLFANRTFAISCVMMFMLGLALFGSTSADSATAADVDGLHGAAGGNGAVTGRTGGAAVMPVVGILVSKLDARYLIAFGFGVSALALYHMTSLDLKSVSVRR